MQRALRLVPTVNVGVGSAGFALGPLGVHLWISQRRGLCWNWRDGFVCLEGAAVEYMP